MAHRPRKRFGQNFLQDQHIIAAILRRIHLSPDDNCLEIGPGMGALTRPMLRQLSKLTAVEIDTDLHAQLAAMPEAADRLRLICADALTIDYTTFGPDLRVIGNLPYNISTPLLIRLLQQVDLIKDMHFMLQKEVVERLAASPGSKTYGRLSVMAQYYCEVTQLFDVPPEAFYPRPNVHSAIVRLTPFSQNPFVKLPFERLEYWVARAFAMRRKTLANNLKGMIDASDLAHLGLDPKARPEQISVEGYVKLAHFLE